MSTETSADAANTVIDGRWATIALSRVGASHQRRSIECQDHSAAAVATASGDWVGDGDDGRGDSAYLVVADGHGSVPHFRSHVGARLAVDALKRAFRALHRSLPAPDEVAGEGQPAPIDPLHQSYWRDWAPRFVVSEWRSLVYEDLLSYPPGDPDAEPSLARLLDHLRERYGEAARDRLLGQLVAFQAHAADHRDEDPVDGGPSPLPLPDDPRWDRATLGSWHAIAYGTTLLGVLVGPAALYWFRIGDGAMVQVVGDGAHDLEPPPPEALGDQTPSLCDDEAVNHVAVNAVPVVPGHVPSALLLTTDGVPNSFSEPEGFRRFCDELVGRAAAEPAVVAERLPDWLDEMSRRGSGDDVTLAMAWRAD